MTIGAKRRGRRNGAKGKRHKFSQQEQERLKILRLDLHTIMEQIRLLDQEMEVDPCLSREGVAVIVTLLDALKQDLEGTRLRIRELKGSTAA